MSYVPAAILDLAEPLGLSVKETERVEGVKRATIYNRLARKEYLAVKDGNRLIILWSSIRARRERFLRPAYFKPLPPRPR